MADQLDAGAVYFVGEQDGDGVADLDSPGFNAAHEIALVVQFGVGEIPLTASASRPTWNNVTTACSSTCSSTTDDHLKNHGMLAVNGDRYVLSPAFDLVPQLTNLGYQMLSIEGSTQESSLELAIQSAAHFDLNADRAKAIVKEMAEVVYGQWWLQPGLVNTPDAVRQRLQACLLRQRAVVGESLLR